MYTFKDFLRTKRLRGAKEIDDSMQAELSHQQEVQLRQVEKSIGSPFTNPHFFADLSKDVKKKSDNGGIAHLIDNSYPLNTALRSGKKLTPSESKIVQGLDRHLNRSELAIPHPIIAYRSFTDSQLAKLNRKGYVIDRGYGALSGSKHIGNSLSDGGRNLMKVIIPRGFRCKITTTNEREIRLPRNVIYRKVNDVIILGNIPNQI